MSPSSDNAKERAGNLVKLVRRWVSLLTSPKESDRLLGIRLISQKVAAEIRTGTIPGEKKKKKKQEQELEAMIAEYAFTITKEILCTIILHFCQLILIVKEDPSRQNPESFAVGIEMLRGLRSIMDAATENKRLLPMPNVLLDSTLKEVLTGNTRCCFAEGEEEGDKVDTLTCEAIQVIASHARMVSSSHDDPSTTSASSSFSDYFVTLLPFQFSKAFYNDDNNETVRVYALFSLGWTLPLVWGHLNRGRVRILILVLSKIACDDPCRRNKEFSLTALMEVLVNGGQQEEEEEEEALVYQRLYGRAQSTVTKFLVEETTTTGRVVERVLAVFCVLSMYTRNIAPMSQTVSNFSKHLPLKEVKCWNLHIFHALLRCDPNDLKDRPLLVLEVAASAYANNWRAKTSVEDFLSHSRKHFEKDYLRAVAQLKDEERVVISDAEKGLGKSGPFPCKCCQEWTI